MYGRMADAMRIAQFNAVAYMMAPYTRARANAKKDEDNEKATSTDVVAPSNTRTAFSRAMTNTMKVAQFASIACVMLSAATIIMETKNLQDTLENMRRGSPCEKAAQLRKIKKELDALPDTRVLAEGWEAYLQEAARQSTNE